MSIDSAKGKILADFKVLIGDAEELLKATSNVAGEKATVARQHIERSLDEGKRSLAQAEDLLLDKSREVAKSTENYVRENPWNAVGIAAGVGLILGMLLRRS